MPTILSVLLFVLCLSMIGSRDHINAQVPRPLSPKAAQQYVADSEKAASGDPDAAYRMGEAFESGRWGGLKDLNKALMFYRLAAKNGHQQASARVTFIEAELAQGHKKVAAPSPSPSQGH